MLDFPIAIYAIQVFDPTIVYSSGCRSPTPLPLFAIVGWFMTMPRGRLRVIPLVELLVLHLIILEFWFSEAFGRDVEV